MKENTVFVIVDLMNILNHKFGTVPYSSRVIKNIILILERLKIPIIVDMDMIRIARLSKNL